MAPWHPKAGRIRWNFGKLSIDTLLQLILLSGIGNAKHFGMAQCGISLVVTALGIAQAQWAGSLKDEGRLCWLCPAQVEGHGFVPKMGGILPTKYEAFEKNMMINLHFGVCDSSRQPDLRVLMSHVFHQDISTCFWL